MAIRLTDTEVVEDRIERFEAFRETLSPEEKRGLDMKLLRWKETINQRGQQFGAKMVKELFMAIMEQGELTDGATAR